MEIKMSSAVVAVLLAALCMVANAMSIPAEVKQNDIDLDEGAKALGERATWLDTRDLEQDFKQLVYIAVQELAAEGKIAPIVDKASQKMAKRGRWQGFCFRRTRTGRFLPYICWKGDRK